MDDLWLSLRFSHYIFSLLCFKLREDVEKGVYVENLSEFEVGTVSDILRLLIQVKTINHNFAKFVVLVSFSLSVHMLLYVHACV